MANADEEYKVLVVRDTNTNQIVEEDWRHPTTNRRHRLGGPAFCRYDPKTGVLVRAQHYINGIESNNGAEPHSRGWDSKTGIMTFECWVDENGRVHRDNGLPAKCNYHRKSGKLIEAEYYQHGVRKNESGSLVIHYNARSGKIVREMIAEMEKDEVWRPSPPYP